MSGISRRRLLQLVGPSLLGASCSGWLPALAEELAADPRRKRHCVLLWMTGGPSQLDTFDMKPGHPHGGEFKEIETKVPGLRFSEHLPKLAQQADRLAVVRGLTTKEGDHGRGTHLMRTGHPPMGPVRYPAIGASLAKEMAAGPAESLNYVSIAPYRDFNLAAFGPGFLGARYAPLTVGENDSPPADNRPGRYAELKVDHLQPYRGLGHERFARRVGLWRGLEDAFVARHPTGSAESHATVYQRALGLMNSELAQAFELDSEPAAVREAYGKGRFGQGCLMARRLIERGVAFVEVSLGSISNNTLGWDTHLNNFPAVRSLSEELDAGWGTLMQELEERGLLDVTTLIWMGEFGRTPKINENAGRDHFPTAWTCVFAGGGIHGGQAYGRTSPDGMEVEEGKVEVGDVLATLCAAVGVPPGRENVSEVGRPIKIAEGQPISAIVKT